MGNDPTPDARPINTGQLSTYTDDTLNWHTNGGWRRDYKTISVQHQKNYMKYGGKFHCKIISIAPVDNSKQFTNEKAYFKNGLRVRRMHLSLRSTRSASAAAKTTRPPVSER